MKKKILVALLSLTLVLALVACSTSAPADSTPATQSAAASGTAAASTAPTEETSTKQFTIGYATSDLSSEYNMMVHNSMEAVCAAQGIKLVTLSADGDANTQVQQIENLITMGVDSLIVYPVDPKVVGDAMKKAKDAGIYVVNADQITDPANYDVAISADMHDLGVQCVKMASEWIDKTFPDAPDGSVKVAVLGVWVNEQFAERCDVMTKIADYNKKATVVKTYDLGTMTSQADISNNTAILLQEHPDINVILSFTDMFAMLADEVVMQNASSMDLTKFGQFTVDRSAAGFQKIKDSQTNDSSIRGTIVPGINIAQDLVDAATQKIDKSKFLENNVYNEPLFAVTADNVDQYMDLNK